MSALVRIEHEPHETLALVRIGGEVDASNVAEVGDQLRSAVTNRSEALVVDLTSTEYLDSSGINLLFAVGHELRARQQVLRLVVDPGSPIARMIQITSLDAAHPTYPTAAEALAAS